MKKKKYLVPIWFVYGSFAAHSGGVDGRVGCRLGAVLGLEHIIQRKLVEIKRKKMIKIKIKRLPWAQTSMWFLSDVGMAVALLAVDGERDTLRFGLGLAGVRRWLGSLCQITNVNV